MVVDWGKALRSLFQPQRKIFHVHVAVKAPCQGVCPSTVLSINETSSWVGSWQIYLAPIYVPQLPPAYTCAQAKVKTLLLAYFKYRDFHTNAWNHHFQIVCANRSNSCHLLLFQVYGLSNPEVTPHWKESMLMQIA